MRISLIIILLFSFLIIGDNQRENQVAPVIYRDTIHQMNGDIYIYEKFVY